MWKKLKHALREFAASPAGRRFQDSYRRHHKTARSGGFRLAVVLVIAAVLVTVGLVGLVVPGPGTLFIAAGAAIVARESRPFSKLLDKLDLKLQPVYRWIGRRWRALRGKPARKPA